MTDYLPITVMGALALVFAIASILLSHAFRPNRPNPVKLSAYECGNDPVRLPGGERFSVKFYVVAMLFIIFDIETVFLIPWGTIYLSGGAGTGGPSTGFLLAEMLVFMLILAVGYVYVWKRGALQWN